MKKILMVLAPENFRDSEYIVPRAFWEQLGATVETTSLTLESKGRFGYEVVHGFLLDEARAVDYDGIFFVGGGGSLIFREDEVAKSLTLDFVAANKVYGAICAAPQNFAVWGLLAGKRCTGFNDDGKFAALCASVGAEFVDSPAVTDGKLCTGTGPTAAEITAIKYWELLTA